VAEVGVVSKLAIKPGMEKLFEERFAEQAANCKAREPGQLLYKLFKSRSEPGVYHIMARYVSPEAHAAHRDSEHIKKTVEGTRECFAAPSQPFFLDAV
jgi:quinol monooxygenase YgiN